MHSDETAKERYLDLSQQLLYNVYQTGQTHTVTGSGE
jgi:hypothetical protein